MSNEIPEGFKMTEIGLIPEDWELSTIGNLFNIKQGKSLSTKSRQGTSPSYFLRTANVLWGRLDLTTVDKMDFTKEETDVLSLQVGDLLVCEGGDVGRTAIWNNELYNCYYQNHLHRLRRKDDNVFPMFYMYWMQAAILLLRLYIGHSNKTTIPNLSASRLKAFVLPIPPLPEQKAIASILSAIQTAKEKTDAVIKATKELKRSLMKHLFTYGPVPIDEAENVPLKETEIGLIPEDWDVISFTNAIIKSNIKVGKVRQQDYKQYGLFPIIDQSQSYIAGYWNNINDIYEGDLPIIIFGDHTRTVKYIDFRFVCGADGTKIIIPNKKILFPKFLFFVLLRLDIPSRGYNCHYSLLKEKLIPLPPLHIQQQIADILSAVDKKIEAEENKSKALNELFKAMLNNLMTGKIRVNIPKGDDNNGQ